MRGNRFTLKGKTMAGLVIGLSMIANLVACGGSSSKTTPPPPTVSIVATSGSPQTATAGAAFAAPLVATVTTGGSPTSGVTVTFAAPSTGASGSFAGGKNTATTDSTGKATSAVFTANSSAGSYTVTASVSGASTPASFSLTNTAAAVQISATSGSGQTATGGTAFAAPLIATVTTGGTPTSGVIVTFTAPSTGASGSFAGGVSTATTDSNGKATSAVFTANSTAGAYTVKATAPGAASSASFSLTNTAATLANGNYVFSLAGNDKVNGTYFYAGVFTVAGGAITAGEQHYSDDNYLKGLEPITGGTIAANADGTLAITLNFTDTFINSGAGTVTLDASVVSSTKALLTEYDSWATASGELDLQGSFSTPSGSYAFNSTGLDHFGQHFSFGGVINVDGAGTISGTGSIVDVNDLCASRPTPTTCAAAAFPNQVVKASTVSTPDVFGYVFFFLDFDCTVGTPDPELCGTLSVGTPAEIELDGYMIDNSHIRLIEFSNNDSLNGTTGGTALGQTGTFSATSVSGSTYVIGSAGLDSIGKLQVAGLLTFNSGGTVSGNLSFNDQTGQSPQGGEPISSGNWTEDTTGRVTITNITTTATPVFTYNLVLYPTGDGHALVISMDSTTSNEELAGTAAQQTSSPLTAASVSGSYAVNVLQFSGLNEQDGVGALTADGVSSLTGFLDLNKTFTSATLVPDATLSDTFATSGTNGVFSVTDTVTPTTLLTMYLVDNTQGVIIENDASLLTLGSFALKH
jgi:hypothetical protein